MSEERENLYDKISKEKKYLRAYNKGENNFSINFPIKAFDKIIQFYGKENLTPNSFIIYHTIQSKTSFIRQDTVTKELEDGGAKHIFEKLDHYYIFPKTLKDFDENDIDKKNELGIRLKAEYFQNILHKAELDFDSLIDYVSIEIVSTEEIEETTTKTRVSYHIYENIFKLIPLLLVKFENGEKFDISFYSYKKILDKCGIKLDEIIPYLHIEKKEINRDELMKMNIPLNESSKVRKLRDKINPKIKEDRILFIGFDTCHKFEKIPFDNLEENRNKESIKLHELLDMINKKKEDLKKIYNDLDNQIIEIKDNNNKVVFIRKKIFDSIISSPESQFDEYKIKDINDKEIIVSKKILKENKNPILVKVYNKNNKEEYIYIIIKDIEDIFKKFEYFRQEDTFKGKNKDDESKEIKSLMMDIDIDILPKLDESKPLFSIPGEEALYDKTKNDLLNLIKEDNKDILICKKNNKFILLNTVNKIKERDSKSKNKNIKYKIRDIINKEEIIIYEYKDIFDGDIPGEFILICNKDTPNEKIIINKNDLLNELNSWNDPNNKIKLKNYIDDNEIEIEPSKINIITPEKEEIPQNYENTQDEIIKKIASKNIVIKNNNNFIKKTIVSKILEDKDNCDIYYIKDIKNKKIKVSKNQLIKDNDDELCQYISVTTEDEPNKEIIFLAKDLKEKLEEDPMEESITIKDSEGNNYTLKKSKILVTPQEIEDINLEDQPQKVKNLLIKNIKDYFYLFVDKENKPHYIRGDILKSIKNYHLKFPIDNFEVEDEKGNKILIPKETANKLLEDNNEKKYVYINDEESKGDPIMVDLETIEKSENDLDEPIEIDKNGRKIKLKNIKITILNEINSLGEQPEEKIFEQITILTKDIEKKEPLSEIVQVKDANNNDIFIYEDTLNKIEENKDDPEKTTYKGNNPKKEEFICNKNPVKSSNNTFIKLVDQNIIVDKNDLEKAIKEFKPDKKTIKIKDIKGNETDLDPLNIKIYKATPEETDIIKILPADFSDINERILSDITPQNILILTKDLNNQDVLINKKTGDNLEKYPKNNFDNYTLFDKDGKKVKISRKKIEKDNNDNNCKFIEIIDNSKDGDNSEIVCISEITEVLKDKENEDFEIKNKEGKKIKLNKKKIEVRKQKNKYIEIPVQGEEIKKILLSEIKDSFIKVKDSKNNKDTFLRSSQLDEIINYKPKAPFINYELLNPKNEIVHITKEMCQQKKSDPSNNKLILCYDENQKDKSFLVPLEKIENSSYEGDDQFDIGDGQKIIFKNLKIKKLENAPKIGIQPEEEKMIKILSLINNIKIGPSNKNYKTINIEGITCFVNNNYINKLKNTSEGDENNTKYIINDSFGNNKITLNKEIIDKDNKPGEYILIKNKNNNQDYLIDSNNLLENLSNFKSTDDEINIVNAVNNDKITLNPLDIEIVPPFKDYPLEKISTKKILPKKIEDNNDIENIPIEDDNKIENEKNDEEKGKKRLRAMPRRAYLPDKKIYKIRRAIIYRKNRKEDE